MIEAIAGATLAGIIVSIINRTILDANWLMQCRRDIFDEDCEDCEDSATSTESESAAVTSDTSHLWMTHAH